jgi:hypothetical protein
VSQHQRWHRHQVDPSDDNSATMATRRHHNDSDGASAKTVTMSIATTAMTPAP